jgi:histidinol-phosphate aminotransferase
MASIWMRSRHARVAAVTRRLPRVWYHSSAVTAPDPLRHLHPHLRGGLVTFAAGEPGDDTLRLDLNEGAYGPTRSALAAIEAATARLNRYPQASGGVLRERLARRLGVAPEMLLFGPGSNALGSLLIRIVAGPGRRVAYSWPGFPTYGMAAERIGAEPLPVPLAAAGADDLDALARAAERSAIVFLATPANPTGRVVTDGLEEFVAAASRHALVVLDEAYHEYAPPVTSGVDLLRRGHECVVLRTFSKAWGLAGARLGYGVMAAPLAAVARSAQDTFEVSSVAFAAAAAALDDQDEIDDRVAENARVRAALTDRLSALGIPTYESAANFVCAAPPDPDDFTRRLAERGILVRVLDAFGDPSRVRIGVPAERDLERLLDGLAAAR